MNCVRELKYAQDQHKKFLKSEEGYQPKSTPGITTASVTYVDFCNLAKFNESMEEIFKNEIDDHFFGSRN